MVRRSSEFPFTRKRTKMKVVEQEYMSMLNFILTGLACLDMLVLSCAVESIEMWIVIKTFSIFGHADLDNGEDLRVLLALFKNKS